MKNTLHSPRFYYNALLLMIFISITLVSNESEIFNNNIVYDKRNVTKIYNL